MKRLSNINGGNRNNNNDEEWWENYFYEMELWQRAEICLHVPVEINCSNEGSGTGTAADFAYLIYLKGHIKVAS